MVKFLNGSEAWIEVDGERCPEYEPILQDEKGNNARHKTVYIVAEKDKEFVVRWKVKEGKPRVRLAQVSVDEVRARKFWVRDKDFGKYTSCHGWNMGSSTVRAFQFGKIDTDDGRERGSFEEQLGELMRACIKLQFGDAKLRVVKQKSKPKPKPKPKRTSTQSANASGSPVQPPAPRESDSADSPEIASPVNSETKIVAQVGLQIKPGRLIRPGAPQASLAAPPTSAVAPPRPPPAATSLTADDEGGSPDGSDDDGIPSEGEASSDESSQSEYDPGKKVAKKKVVKEVKKYKSTFNKGAEYSVRWLYRPQAILVTKGIMPDPEAAETSSPNKRKRNKAAKAEATAGPSETPEQKKRRLEELLLAEQERSQAQQERIQAQLKELVEGEDELELEENGGPSNAAGVKLEDEDRPKNQKIYIDISDDEEDG